MASALDTSYSSVLAYSSFAAGFMNLCTTISGTWAWRLQESARRTLVTASFGLLLAAAGVGLLVVQEIPLGTMSLVIGFSAAWVAGAYQARRWRDVATSRPEWFDLAYRMVLAALASLVLSLAMRWGMQLPGKSEQRRARSSRFR